MRWWRRRRWVVVDAFAYTRQIGVGRWVHRWVVPMVIGNEMWYENLTPTLRVALCVALRGWHERTPKVDQRRRMRRRKESSKTKQRS